MVAFRKSLVPSTRRSADIDRAAPPRMRLVPIDFDDNRGDADEGQDTLGRIDRRIFPRQNLSMHVMGRRLDHTVDARREPCLHLSMRDVSVGGLCAISQTPVNVGEHIAVFFPPEGVSRGWDAYGQVLRVRPDRVGYQVAVSFDRLPAA